MAEVTLRAPLKDLAEGSSQVSAEGASLFEVLHVLERDHPRLAGWILDEQGQIRRHVNVFVNGERTREDGPVTPQDQIHVLPSITGGSA